MAGKHHIARNPLAGKHIIVSGAGIAGLAFTRAIDKYWKGELAKPRITIYEKGSQKPSPEREGYSISIRSDAMSGGMQALQKLGILDDVLAASITGQHGGVGAFTIWDENWKTLLQFKPPKNPSDGLPASSMRIARYILRQHLIDALPDSTQANWALGCTSVSKLEDGRMKVTLSDGSTDECDFLVAADGANSVLRGILRPNDTLSYAGAVCLAGVGKFPSGLPKPVDIDHGIVIGGGGTSLFASPVDDHSAVWNISMLEDSPRETLRGQAAMDRKDGILGEARRRGKDFGLPFEELIDASDPATLMVFNAMDKQPIDHGELDSLPLLFIGDANHAVSPFAGNGANMALMDGIDLAVELSNASDLPSAIAAFDAKSRARSKRTVDSSRWIIQVAHSTGWRLWVWKSLLRFINFLMSFRR